MAPHKRYPSYKSTSDIWFGEAPSHWDELPNRAFLKIHKDVVGDKSSDLDLLSLTLRGIVWRDKDSGEGKFPESFDGYQYVAVGDLVFCLFDMDETPRTIGLSQYSGMITSAYTVMRPSERAHSKYVYYYYLNHDNQKSLKPYYSGLRKVVTKDTFKSIKVSLPPYEEQACIANFLDRETAKIDELIQKQEELIVLLGEKRKLVISNGVTRGLNPNLEMKESGISWLNRIPRGWNLCPFKSIVKFQEGPGIMADDFKESGIPLLRISCIKGRYTTLDGCMYLDPEKVAKKWAHFRVQLGDLLISASATMGTVTEVTEEAVGAVPYTGIIRLFPGVKILKDFLALFVVSDLFLTQIDLLKTGSAMQHFGPYHLNQMKIVVPPLDDQEEILDKVNPLLSQIDTLKLKAEEAIGLMKEHRASLISAAVTGKIMVIQ